MWETLGFKASPYDTTPLKTRKEDVDLLVGRESEAVELCTTLDNSPQGILVLSGSPGVGKTSFMNVQMYLLENQLAPFGPKVMAPRFLCPTQPNDDLKSLAIRILDSLYKSVSQWCNINDVDIPKETKKLGKWISGNLESGLEFGITIAGFGGSVGRTINLPPIGNSSFETTSDAIAAITAEVVTQLGFRSAVITIDNLENYSEEQLGAMLIGFRDTLFSIPNTWWILIGQSGLGSLIQVLDSRVFERITGSGIEIKPIEFNKLDSAIGIRVSRFHSSGDGKAPLTTDTHRQLFDASFGEMRFVFKYSETLCIKFVEDMRRQAIEFYKKRNGIVKDSFKIALNEVITEALTSDQIPIGIASYYLQMIIKTEINGLSLKPKEIEVLARIGSIGKARASDYKEFGIKTMQDFSSHYLTNFFRQKLLIREQEGRAVIYRLRGAARLAYSFGLFKQETIAPIGR